MWSYLAFGDQLVDFFLRQEIVDLEDPGMQRERFKHRRRAPIRHVAHEIKRHVVAEFDRGPDEASFAGDNVETVSLLDLERRGDGDARRWGLCYGKALASRA